MTKPGLREQARQAIALELELLVRRLLFAQDERDGVWLPFRLCRGEVLKQ
jgi:hypothetical protein